MTLEDRLALARGRLEEALTLFCLWEPRKKDRRQLPDAFGVDHDKSRYFGAKVDITRNVEARLRNLTNDLLDSVYEREAAEYGADAELDVNQAFLITEAADLQGLEDIQSAVGACADLEPASLRELPGDRMKVYGFAAGDGVERLGFIKKANPFQMERGRKFFGRGGRRVEELQEPLLALDANFDFIVGSDWAIVLSQQAFELLVRESPGMQARIAEWIDGIEAALPLTDDSIEALRDTARRDARLWRKLRAIHRGGKLSNVAIEEVENYAKQVGLDPEKLIIDGKLRFSVDDRFAMLKLLNEDLYAGGLTGEHFEAQRKGRFRA